MQFLAAEREIEEMKKPPISLIHFKLMEVYISF